MNEYAKPQQEMMTIIAMQSFLTAPASNMRRYWNSKDSLMSVVDTL
jgi:hypothetical protein